MSLSVSYVLFAVLALAGVSIPVPAQTRLEPPDSIPGCYELVLGRWSRPLGVNGAYHQLPATVRLDTVAASRGGWVLHPDIAYPSEKRLQGFPRWLATPDSIELSWSNGFQATTVRLRRARVGDMVGLAEVWSDANEFGSDVPRAPVRARRTDCTR
jgi:hypothetical protein